MHKKLKEVTIKLILDENESGYSAFIEEMPGVNSQGDNIYSALDNIADAYFLFLLHYEDNK